MAYKLNVTEHADELPDNLVYHLVNRLKNKQAARHLLDSIDAIYDRLENNPYQYPECRDTYFAKKGYREVVVPQMNYKGQAYSIPIMYWLKFRDLVQS